MSPKKATQKSAKSTTASGKKFKGFTDEERVAMKERIQELKADKADGEDAVLAKIGEMPEPERAMGKRLHAIIKASAPALSPRLWYGMPAYAKDDKVVMWPVAFALKELTATEEARIGTLVKKAVS